MLVIKFSKFSSCIQLYCHLSNIAKWDVDQFYKQKVRKSDSNADVDSNLISCQFHGSV